MFDPAIRLMHQYCQALDEHNWDGLAALFPPQFTLDFEEMMGRPSQIVSSPAFVDLVTVLLRPLVTMHVITNPLTTASDDCATGGFGMIGIHRTREAAARRFDMYGWYDLITLRDGGAWRIAELRHRMRWVEGDPTVVDVTAPEAIRAFAALFGESR